MIEKCACLKENSENTYEVDVVSTSIFISIWIIFIFIVSYTIYEYVIEKETHEGLLVVVLSSCCYCCYMLSRFFGLIFQDYSYLDWIEEIFYLLCWSQYLFIIFEVSQGWLITNEQITFILLPKIIVVMWFMSHTSFIILEIYVKNSDINPYFTWAGYLEYVCDGLIALLLLGCIIRIMKVERILDKRIFYGVTLFFTELWLLSAIGFGLASNIVSYGFKLNFFYSVEFLMHFYWLVYLRSFKNVFVILHHGLLQSDNEEQQEQQQPQSILNNAIDFVSRLYLSNPYDVL